MNSYDRSRFGARELLAHHAELLGQHLELVALSLKHPLFNEEREWRYICSVGADEMAAQVAVPGVFGVRGSYIKPFRCLPPLQKTGEAPDLLPITSIVCGPKLDCDMASPAVTQFLQNHGYANVPVDRSEVADVWR